MHQMIQQLAASLSAHMPKPEGNYFYHSVLIPFLSCPDEPHVLFCQRSLHLKSQPGDVCFPGGRAERDETPLETALRETQEEIGVSPSQITLLGQPDYCLLPGNRIVTPFAGLLNCNLEDLRLQKEEVEAVFTVPFSYFLHTAPMVYTVTYAPVFPDDFPYERIVGGKSYAWAKTVLPELFYSYAGYTIWGMTARMIHNVSKMIQ